MVISCPECSTKFRVAAEKIPAKGAKLRCARCSHIFFVQPETEPVTPPVEDTPAVTPPATDAVGTDAPASDNIDFGFEEPEPPSQQPEATADTGAGFSEDSFGDQDPFAEDADFGFGEPQSGTTESTTEADFGFDDSLSESQGSSSDLDFGFEEPPQAAAEKTTAEDREDAFGFDSFAETDTAEIGSGVKDEFDASAFEEDTAATDDAFSFDEDYGNVDIGGKDEDDEAFSFGDDLPDSSDSPASADAPPADEISTEEAAAGFTEAPAGMEPEPQTQPDAAYPPLEESEASAQEPVSAIPVSKKRSPFSSLIMFLLILIIGIVIAGGVLYWQSGPQALEDIYRQVTGQPTASQKEGQILVKNLQGSFVGNKVEGELLVIQGNAVNDYKESRAAIQVKGILFDSQGNQLRQKTIFCGNPISVEDLRTLSYDKLEEIMDNQFGESLVNLNVTPGQVIPFTIVFRDIPDNLSEFVVEVADSNPAAQ